MIPGIQEIKALAIKYSKKQLANMAQTGLIDPQKAVMAGMMRDRIAKEDMQPPSTTVAQDVLGMGPQAQPQMGMQPQMGQPQGQPQPQMPPPQMGAPMGQPPVMAASGGLTDLPVDVQDYAGGGIVAFDDGGAVPGYAGDRGSLVYGGSFEDLPVYVPRERPALQPAGSMGEVFTNLGSAIANPVVDFFSNAPDMNRAARQMVGKPDQGGPRADPVTGEPLSLGEFLRRQEAERGAVTPATAPSTQADVRRVDNEIAASTARRDRTGPADRGPAAPGGIPTGSSLQAPTFKPFDPNMIKLKGASMDMPKIEDIKDIRAARRTAEKEEGVDPELYDKMIKGVEEKKGKLEGKKGEAAGQALMMAGLGLIGARRGEEFQALGASGQKALAAYKDDMKDLRNASEKYDERMEALRIADQQAKKTNSAADISKRDAQEARAQAAKLEMFKAENELTKTGAQVSANVYGTQTQAETSIRTAELSSRTQKEIANLNAATQRYVAGRPPAEIQAIDILSQRTGKPFEQAMKDFYGARAGARNMYTREEAMKDARKNLENRAIINPTEAQVQEEINKLMRIYGGGGGGGGGTLQPGADGTFNYVPSGQ